MHHDISSRRQRILEANAMLRLPVAPEVWGFAGPHQIHALPPLGVAALCRWLAAAAGTAGSWLIARLRRRAATPPVAAASGTHPLRNDAAII